jgi:hypothetical protein
MDIDSTKNADYVNGRWVHTTCAPYVPNGAGVAEPRSLDVIFRRLHDPEDELVRLMRASLGDGNHMVWHKETRAKPWERRGSANATLPADDGVYGLRTTQLVRA